MAIIELLESGQDSLDITDLIPWI